MKIKTELNLRVRVRETGQGNVARILTFGITASSTNSAAVAVDAAVQKFIKRNGYQNVVALRERTSATLGVSNWKITIKPNP